MRADTKTIGEHSYKVTQFGAKKGRSVLFQLSKMLGPALGALTDGDLPQAMAAFARTANENDFDSLCDAFAGSTVVMVSQRLSDGGTREVPFPLSQIFDTHFAGRYGEMLLWLAFSIEVNFSDFLSEGGPLAMAMGSLKKAPASPTE